MAKSDMKVRKGAPKLRNTSRSEHRKNRYAAGLRQRVSALEKMKRNEPELFAKRGGDVRLEKLRRLLFNNSAR